MQNSSQISSRSPSPLARLRKLAAPKVLERCELCGASLAANHQHLLNLDSRELACSCDACAILFSSDQTIRYRRVPRDIRHLAGFELDEEMWESLHIPINLAFLYHSSAAGRVVAMYPSPAGATESLLPIDAWSDLTSLNPPLQHMQDDVEALLMNRVGKRRDAMIVPIDQCYRLVGLIRTHWRGLSGGTEVWRQIERFFDELQQRSRKSGGSAHA